MMSAQQPPFKEGNNVMYARQKLARRFFVPFKENELMDVTFPFQWFVAQPCIGAYDAATFYDVLDKGNQAVGRGIWYGAHSDSTNSFSVFLSGDYNQGLPFRLTAPNALFWAAKIGFVNLNSSNKAVAPKSNHCAPQFVNPSPCSLVATQTQDALEPERISTGLLARYKPHSLKPSMQRLPCSLKNCASCSRCLPLAGCASQKASGGRPSFTSTTSRATKAVRPPKALQIVNARFISRKPTVKFLKCPRIINPADRVEIMAHHYILRLRERNG
jgi:hypothetical protein